MSQSIPIYCEINIISLILPICILFRMIVDKKQSSRQRAFKSVLAAIIVVLISDIVYALVDGRSGDMSRYINYITNMFNMAAATFLTYEWMWFVFCLIPNKVRRRSVLGILTALPFAVVVVLDILTPKFGFLFKLTINNYYIYGPYLNIQEGITYAYFILTLIYLIVKLRLSSTSYENKNYCKIVIACSVLQCIGIACSMRFKRLPIEGPVTAIFLSLTYVYLVNAQVVTDSLTGVNNRRQFDKYLKNEIDKKARTQELYLMLFDMDDFKQINDTYGHDVGDTALKVAAGALKKVYGEFGGFIARFGGDEFAAIIETDEGLIPQILAENLNKELDRINETQKYPFRLQISTGIARFIEDIDDESTFFKKADLDMYTVKKSHKVGR